MKINKEELQEIFKGIYNGEELKFNELYTKYYNLIYSVAFSILKNKENAEDITQTIFTKIYGLPKKQLPAKYEASWLYTITKNEALNYIRKHRNNVNIVEAYLIDNDNQIDNIISKDAYNRIMSKLNEKEREIVSLKIVSNLSFREISKLLNTPIGTVQWIYYKSLNTLKLLITNLSICIITIAFFIGRKIKKKEKNEELQLAESNNNQEKESIEITTEKQINQTVLNNLIEEQVKKEQYEKYNTIIEDTIIQVEKRNLNVVDIGLLSLSGICLFFTIVFSIILIKHKR